MTSGRGASGCPRGGDDLYQRCAGLSTRPSVSSDRLPPRWSGGAPSIQWRPPVEMPMVGSRPQPVAPYRFMARILTALLLLRAAPIAAQIGETQAPPGPADRPSVGLVLSGGGARGFAHIGVL